MILANSSLSRPGLTSTSTPRSLKMATAAGESLSEMRTRGGIGLAFVAAFQSAPQGKGRMRRSGNGMAPSLRNPVVRGAGDGERSSSRRLGELGFFLGEGEIEPV